MMQLLDYQVGLDRPLFLIAGPCVIEGADLVQETAGRLKEITDELGVPFIYKTSFDKANRSSLNGFRGPGLEAGLRILADARERIGVPVLTDVHQDTPLDEVAAVVDILQTPAFLCRQTDFIQAVATQGLPINIKKGQFLAPGDMTRVVEKARATGTSSRWPPELSPRPPGSWAEWVTSKTTGQPVSRSRAKDRMSAIRLL